MSTMGPFELGASMSPSAKAKVDLAQDKESDLLAQAMRKAASFTPTPITNQNLPDKLEQDGELFYKAYKKM